MPDDDKVTDQSVRDGTTARFSSSWNDLCSDEPPKLADSLDKHQELKKKPRVGQQATKSI
jgi:hypothetical protein